MFYCVMPNHWHYVGLGHVYQGRYKSFPVAMPNDWVEQVNRADNEKELQALRRSVQRGRPYGPPDCSGEWPIASAWNPHIVRSVAQA